MENVLMIIFLIVLVVDVLTNAFLLVFYPKWEKIKKQEIDKVREQNEQLTELARTLLNETADK